jgi:hypothetical protein
MAAATVNLTIQQGTTWSQSIQWKTGDPATAVNLTGYTARMQLRPVVTSGTVALSLTSPSSGIAITAATGTFTLSATATTTAAITAGRYVYDLEAVSSGGQVTRVCEGVVTVSAEVTR